MTARFALSWTVLKAAVIVTVCVEVKAVVAMVKVAPLSPAATVTVAAAFFGRSLNPLALSADNLNVARRYISLSSRAPERPVLAGVSAPAHKVLRASLVKPAPAAGGRNQYRGTACFKRRRLRVCRGSTVCIFCRCRRGKGG